MNNRKRKGKKLLCILLTLAVMCSLGAVSAGAVTQSEIDELEAERKALEEKAAAQEQVITELTGTRARFIDRKIALDKKIELNQQQIRLIGDQITLYDEIITEKEAELDTALAAESKQSSILRARMRAMEENSSLSYLAFIFEATSLTDLLSRVGDVSDIMHYDQELEQEFEAAREDVEKIKSGFEETRAEQEALKKVLDTKQTELDAQIEAAYLLIANVDDLAEDAQAEYAAIAAAEAEAEKEVAALIAKKQAEEAAAAAARAAEQGKNSGGSGGGSTSNPGAGYASAASLTSLSWPVPSYSIITSRFGGRNAPTAGASSNHGGLDIGAQQGATIIASEAGEIMAADYNSGYGNYVMINHGNGIVTLYGHMTSYCVSYGETVSKGQTIGYVGSTGVSTGPHLHYEIRLNGERVDPAQYFSGLTYYC